MGNNPQCIQELLAAGQQLNELGHGHVVNEHRLAWLAKLRGGWNRRGIHHRQSSRQERIGAFGRFDRGERGGRLEIGITASRCFADLGRVECPSRRPRPRETWLCPL